MRETLQLLIYGVQLGVIYALIALGYTMVYGIINLINFAHGDLVMIGAFVAYFAAELLGANFPLAIFLAMLIPACLSVAIERLAYRPLRNKPRLSALITAIGVSIFLENFPRMLPFIGPNYRPFPMLIPFKNFTLPTGAVLNSIQIVNILVSVALMVALTYIVHRTKVGRAMRAVSFNKDAASLMGINVNRIIAVTFFLGAALAGAGGVLYSMTSHDRCSHGDLARHQGLHRGGSGGYRLRSRGHAGRTDHGHLRGRGHGPLFRAGIRIGVRDPHSHSPLPSAGLLGKVKIEKV